MNNAMNNEWITVANAARILGVSKQAIRQRIYRDTIPHRKESDGTVLVRITGHNPETNGETNGKSYAETPDDIPEHAEAVSRELIDELRNRIDFVERQLEQANERDRENRRIIAGLVQRVPELEPTSNSSSGPQDSSRTPSGEQENGTGPADDTDPQKRSWWRRLLDIE